MSTVTTLSNLTISSGTLTPAFASGTTGYSAAVANTITSVTVTPTTVDFNATVAVNGTPVASGGPSPALPLLVGPNAINVVVTAQDGVTAETYTIIVTRAPSSDATLSNLTISAGTLTPAFASATLAYSATVNGSVATITVTPTTNNGTATVRVNGTLVTSGTPSAPIPLVVGLNPITVSVTAQDGTTIDTYTIAVTQLSSDATLSNLTISAGTLTPAFAPLTVNYTASVPNATASITVTPTTNNAAATVAVNGAAVNSGTPSAPIPLVVGNNTITTVVTAQDGTLKTYTITVTRAPSNVATLAGLTISSGTLAPAFATGTISYTDAVANAVASVTVTPTTTDATATIAVNGAAVASGAASAPIALLVGPNTITTVVTAQDGTTKVTYTIIVTRAPSTDATLSNLSISAGTLAPAFAPATTGYTASVPNTAASITVTPTTNNAGATVSVNGVPAISGAASAPIALLVGPNTITTLVTAQDGITTIAYTIVVTRAPSTDATLSNLAISSGTLTPAFAPATTGYTASVPSTVASITLTPTTSNAGATVSVNGVPVISGAASAPIALVAGPNTITTVVTAQDGITTITYTLVVTRAPSTDATLSNLAISSGTLTPVFTPATTSYTASVPSTVASITVTPTTNNAGATVSVNGVAVISGAASAPIALLVGPNTITTLVTAQDGITTSTYTIVITRGPSTDATLSNLAISSGTLTPAFAPLVTSYTAGVANTVASITVTPTTSDAGATVSVNGTAVPSGTASAPIALIVGTNIITTVVTAQDGLTKSTYTITVTRAPSAAATLANLTISSGTLTPAFAALTTSYAAAVANAVASITVTPTTADVSATVTVNGLPVLSGTPSAPVALVAGPNTITVLVTAQDGVTTASYTIVVTRAASAIATLSNLTISSGTLTPAFASGTTSYSATVANTVASLTVTPTTSDANATVTVNGNPVSSGTPSAPLPLVVGTNTITLVVTAQDGSTASYTLTVTRALSPVATLSNLVLSSGPLLPAFASGTISYSASVPNATTNVTLTPTVTDPNATVTVNGLAVSSGTPSAAITLQVGTNIITTVVTAQDGTKGTYTITLSRTPSASASLADLTISSGTLSPAFASGTTSYGASVSTTTTSITVTPTASSPTSTITVNGAAVADGTPSGTIPLSLGPNTVTVVVTAQDGITKGTYTVTVTRLPSAIATLSNLVTSSGSLNPPFASALTSYSVGVSNTTASLTVTPTTTDPVATVTVNGAPLASGTASAPIALAIGTNTITIVVTAQDGLTTATYTLTVSRAPSSAATLSNLTISSGSLVPGFAAGTTSYTAAVSNATTSVTLTPTTADPSATVTVNGTPVSSASASAPIALNIGSNVITTVVTAQDGVTKGTYTVTVTRAASAVATLSNLTLSSGSLAPNFASSVTSYAASVTNATASITLTPTLTDPSSTVTVNGTPVASGSASGQIPLVVGPNTIVIIVTAQDGITKNTYTVTVSRAPLSAVTLTNLTISTGSLAPAFNSNIFSYASAVGNATTSVTVTPTTSDASTIITVNGVPVGSGTASGPIPLQIGSNLITVVLKGQGGVTTTYTIDVARGESSNALLSNLVLSNGALSPAFDSNTFSYSSSLDASVSEITVTPTAADPAATIKVNGVTVVSGQPSGPISVLLPDNTITIEVTAADNSTTDTYTVEIHKAAPQNNVIANNILTPNGDGKNDTWLIKDIQLFPNNTVTVYDRSGRIVYTKKGYANEWDGSFNGAPLQEDTYYYLIDLGSGNSKIKGFITVVRRR